MSRTVAALRGGYGVRRVAKALDALTEKPTPNRP
ncbi:hypothetical protein HNP02_003869 [Mycobacterium sp. AZCC_0083]|nr:hypothetical protein [Mycobacterium sp. AZCC_0083]